MDIKSQIDIQPYKPSEVQPYSDLWLTFDDFKRCEELKAQKCANKIVIQLKELTEEEVFKFMDLMNGWVYGKQFFLFGDERFKP